MLDHIWHVSMAVIGYLVSPLPSATGSDSLDQVKHSGGQLLKNETIIKVGLQLVDACWNTYASTS